MSDCVREDTHRFVGLRVRQLSVRWLDALRRIGVPDDQLDDQHKLCFDMLRFLTAPHGHEIPVEMLEPDDVRQLRHAEAERAARRQEMRRRLTSRRQRRDRPRAPR